MILYFLPCIICIDWYKMMFIVCLSSGTWVSLQLADRQRSWAPALSKGGGCKTENYALPSLRTLMRGGKHRGYSANNHSHLAGCGVNVTAICTPWHPQQQKAAFSPWVQLGWRGHAIVPRYVWCRDVDLPQVMQASKGGTEEPHSACSNPRSQR